MTHDAQHVSWKEYADHYGASLGAYLRTDHLHAYTKDTDSHPRFRCRVCGAAVSIDPVDATEYGHYRSARGSWRGGMCPHRDEGAVGANGSPGVGREKGAAPGSAD